MFVFYFFGSIIEYYCFKKYSGREFGFWVRYVCVSMRIEGDEVYVVFGIGGSCCYSCIGREIEVRGGNVVCVIGCVSGENLLGILFLSVILLGLLEVVGENGGIGIE